MEQFIGNNNYSIDTETIWNAVRNMEQSEEHGTE
jgi:hypothetical protein